MTDLVVETPEGLALRYELAGAGSRSAAALLDGLLLGTVLFVALATLVVLLGGAGGLYLWVLTGVVVSFVLYQVGFALALDGRTPGKFLLGLRVVDQQGFPASSVQHVLRGLFWPLEALLVLLPVPLGVILMATTPRHQRLGDLVAGTVVLREPDRRAAPEPFPREGWSTLARRRLELVPAQAARFDGQDLDFLRELLGRVGLDRRSRERLLVRSARHYAGELGIELALDPDPRDAQALLRELFLFLREMRSRPASTGGGARPAPAGSGGDAGGDPG